MSAFFERVSHCPLVCPRYPLATLLRWGFRCVCRYGRIRLPPGGLGPGESDILSGGSNGNADCGGAGRSGKSHKPKACSPVHAPRPIAPPPAPALESQSQPRLGQELRSDKQGGPEYRRQFQPARSGGSRRVHHNGQKIRVDHHSPSHASRRSFNSAAPSAVIPNPPRSRSRAVIVAISSFLICSKSVARKSSRSHVPSPVRRQRPRPQMRT